MKARDRVTFTREFIAKRGDITRGSIGVIMRANGNVLTVLVDTANGKRGIDCKSDDCKVLA